MLWFIIGTPRSERLAHLAHPVLVVVVEVRLGGEGAPVQHLPHRQDVRRREVLGQRVIGRE